MTTQSTQACPVCESVKVRSFFQLDNIPRHCNVLHETREASLRIPRGDIDLTFCEDCGMIFNAAFESESMDYDVEYENALHYSPRFETYCSELVSRLIGDHDLRGKTIAEIGCGDGHFLRMICQQGGNTGFGFDPSQQEQHWQQVDGVRLVREYYRADLVSDPIDLICCRHVLEHLPQPRTLVQQLRESANDRPTRVYFEVPDARYTLEQGGVWDILYEHCNYFTATSLKHLFRRCGFSVLSTASVFGGQFLQLDAVANSENSVDADSDKREVNQLGDLVDAFAGEYQKQQGVMRKRLEDAAQRNLHVAVWGAGTKGVMFLNSHPDASIVEQVVDVNPRKHGKFVAGTGQPIVGPQHMTDSPSDLVILMNPNYRDEVEQQITSLGIRTAVNEFPNVVAGV